MLQNILDQEDFDKPLESFESTRTILKSVILQLAQGTEMILTLRDLCLKVPEEEGKDRAKQIAKLFKNGIVESEGGVPLLNVVNNVIIYSSVAHVLHGIVRTNGNFGVSYASLFASLHEHMCVTHLVKDDMSRWFKKPSADLMPPEVEKVVPPPAPIQPKKINETKSQEELLKD